MISWDDSAIGMQQLPKPLIEVDELLRTPAVRGEITSMN